MWNPGVKTWEPYVGLGKQDVPPGTQDPGTIGRSQDLELLPGTHRQDEGRGNQDLYMGPTDWNQDLEPATLS